MSCLRSVEISEERGDRADRTDRKAGCGLISMCLFRTLVAREPYYKQEGGGRAGCGQRGRGGQRGQRGHLFFVSKRTIGRLLEGYWKVLRKREVEYY